MTAHVALADLPALVGKELGRSAWHTITQEQIDTFARATGDFAAIHVDSVAAAGGPYGRTIAHGFLTLSLVASLSSEAFVIDDAGSIINYGVNRVRFPAAVPVGSRIQLSTALAGIETRPAGQLLTLGFTIHIEGSDRAAAVGETILLAIPEHRE